MVKSNEFKSEILLIVAGLSFGNTPILSAILRDHNVSSVEQVFIRSFVASLFGLAVIISFFYKSKDQVLNALTKTNQIFYMIQGIILDIMISVYFIAIALNTPAGESALLVQVHPILTLILGTLILHERMDKNKIISLLIAFLGIIILIRPWEGDSIFTHVVGDFFALCNGIFYSFYLIIGRSTKEKRINISPLLSIGFVMVWTFICYIPMLFVFTTIPLDPIINRFTFSTYNDLFVIIFGIGLGLLGSVLPYGLIMIASRHVESSRQAILLLGEPLGAIIFGFLILSEPITIYYIIGGGLLLFAIIYLTIIGSKPSTKASILIEEN